MKKAAMAARVGNRILSIMAGILILLMLSYGVYSLWDTYKIYANSFADEELLKFRPTDDGEDNPTLKDLKKLNPDVKAWIQVPKTNIDYPVVQGQDVKLRIPSMIVTTGLALIYESLANYMAGGVEQTLPAHLRAFGRMPWDIILALVACVVAYIFLNYTKIGTYTYAIGSDEFVAKNMGINVNKYKVLAFILSGAFLGVMAILTISYGSSMVAVTGMASMSRNFVPTMGCFFGLAFKKYGMPLPAIIIGEFVINIIFFGFIALGAPTAIQDVITGLALLIIITVTTKATKGEIVK